MTLEEMAQDMARTLLAEPAHEVIRIWRTSTGEWGWGRVGVSDPPAGAEVLVHDRVDNSDADVADENGRVDAYATEIVTWLMSEILPAEPDTRPSVSKGQQELPFPTAG